MKLITVLIFSEKKTIYTLKTKNVTVIVFPEIESVGGIFAPFWKMERNLTLF